MQLSDVKLAHEYLENLKRLKLLVNTPSSAELPRNLLKALSDLCINNIAIRNEFYDFIHKLGNKYSKITLQKINDL